MDIKQLKVEMNDHWWWFMVFQFIDHPYLMINSQLVKVSFLVVIWYWCPIFEPSFLACFSTHICDTGARQQALRHWMVQSPNQPSSINQCPTGPYQMPLESPAKKCKKLRLFTSHTFLQHISGRGALLVTPDVACCNQHGIVMSISIKHCFPTIIVLSSTMVFQLLFVIIPPITLMVQALTQLVI